MHLDIILPAPSSRFQAYNMLYDHDHMPLYYLRNKEKIKSKKIDKRKRKSKYKGSSIL